MPLHALARAGLAHQTQSPFLGDGEVNAIDCMDIGIFGLIMDYQVFYIKY